MSVLLDTNVLVLCVAAVTLDAATDEVNIGVDILGAGGAETSEYFYLVMEPASDSVQFKSSKVRVIIAATHIRPPLQHRPFVVAVNPDTGSPMAHSRLLQKGLFLQCITVTFFFRRCHLAQTLPWQSCIFHRESVTGDGNHGLSIFHRRATGCTLTTRVPGRRSTLRRSSTDGAVPGENPPRTMMHSA